jgi:cell fate (sporulation/competence/biofilm development) regulator YmcA (YheA/YmcA/DUF963 family)
MTDKQQEIDEINAKWQKAVDQIDANYAISKAIATTYAYRKELVENRDEEYFKASHIRNLALENIEKDYEDKGWI